MILLSVITIAFAKENTKQVYSNYFKSVEMLGNATCYITAFDIYKDLELSRKRELIKQILPDSASVIVIVYGIYRELWKWNNNTGIVDFIDVFRTNEVVSLYDGIMNNQKIKKHPLFFHVGGMQNLDTNGNLNVYFNSRIGSYLLYEKLDLALSFTLMMNGNISSNNLINQTMFGVMSKYYYPIPKYNISPNAGLEFSIMGNGTSPTVAFLLGISWHIGPGSLDLGFRLRDGVTTMLGYTYILF